MQKVKEIITGKHESSPTTDRTSREYNTTDNVTGNGASNYGRTSTGGSGYNTSSTGERLTGDRAGVAGTGAGTGASNFTSGGSGLTGNLTGNRTGESTLERTEDRLTGDRSNTTGTSSMGRAEDRLTGDRSGVATSPRSSTGTGAGGALSEHLTDRHTRGHDPSLASKFDPSAETTHHDHKHLNHVTQRDVRHQEIEEVQRQREVERHVHHVQHHVQPIIDKQVGEEIHHETVHPTTTIREQHVNTDDDVALFRGLGEKHRDTETHRAKERTIVDLGERVTETTHHHVHHVTQPVIQQEVIDRHKIHTVIPIKHVTEEAPIIHKSSLHEPIGIEDFKKGGGVLGSGISLDKANVLQTGECERSVDGIGERLAQELHLGSSSHSSYGSNTGTGSGLTGSHNHGSNVGTGSGLTGNGSGLTGNSSSTTGRI